MLWNDVRSKHLFYSLVVVWAQSYSDNGCKNLINVNPESTDFNADHHDLNIYLKKQALSHICRDEMDF